MSLKGEGSRGRCVILGDSLLAGEFLKQLYASRNFAPAWMRAGRLLPSADTLVVSLDGAEHEGLNPDDYHRAVLDSALHSAQRLAAAGQPVPPASLAELELLLSDALVICATHLAYGKVDHETAKTHWAPPADDTILVRRLPDALGAPTAGSVLQNLVPAHPAYRRLRQALAWLQASPLESRRTLFGESVLCASGKSLSPSILRDFQRRYGMDTTGILDSLTKKALRIPVEERLEQILCNLDRWRQLPHDLGRRYVLVNIPEFRLTVVEEEREEMTMKVVLGLPSWPTPILSSTIEGLVFNPHWLSPTRIFVKELINYVRADSNYLVRNGMTLVRDSSGTLLRIDPGSIPWETANPDSLDLQLLQEPGPENIVGRLKFLMPNEHHIFLHDTPYRDDFAKRIRMASHGCIRLEAPFSLALYALRGMEGWARDRIDSVLEIGAERMVSLKAPLPVHVAYCTMWQDSAGKMHWREDIYGLDRRMAKSLASPPPPSSIPMVKGTSKSVSLTF